MTYPRRSPYLVFYKRVGKEEYKVENHLYSEAYRLDFTTAAFLRQLDGRHDPYALLPKCDKEYVRRLLRNLKDCNLLAPEKKLLTVGIGSCMYPLIYCYPGRIQKLIARIWNLLLLALFIPMFIIGMCIYSSGSISVYMESKGEIYLGMLIGVGVGILSHELSHSCAGLAYGAHLWEIGIGTDFFIPMGYVLLDDAHISNRFHRIQINAAGIEMNLLLYGVFMCLIPMGFLSSFVMYLAALENLGLALFNILPLEGLDGIKILSIILRKKDLLKHAKKMIKQRRHHGKNIGRSAAIIASYVLVGFQIVIPILLVFEGYSLMKLILM